MASSMSSHGPSGSELAKAGKDKREWERNSWNSEHVAYAVPLPDLIIRAELPKQNHHQLKGHDRNREQ